MSQCQGNITASTKVDRETLDFLDREAERLGVSRAELFRRLIDQYREASTTGLRCPYCANDLRMEL